MEVSILRFNNKPVSIELPIKIELKVTEAPPDAKGNSGGNVTKPITLETGLVVNAPMFIKEGDTVRVDTRDGQYVERANSLQTNLKSPLRGIFLIYPRIVFG